MKRSFNPTFAGALWLGLLFAPLVQAAETTYRDPGDMTEQERAQLMVLTNQYNKCVYTESMARVEALPDIRQAADEGMTACRPVIDELKATVSKAGFEPGLGDQFAHSAQNRVVKMLIPELALRKSGN